MQYPDPDGNRNDTGAEFSDEELDLEDEWTPPRRRDDIAPGM